jgi:hypothetical protein
MFERVEIVIGQRDLHVNGHVRVYRLEKALCCRRIGIVAHDISTLLFTSRAITHKCVLLLHSLRQQKIFLSPHDQTRRLLINK